MIFSRFKKFVRENDLLGGGGGVVLAVSGGVDSMVMLDLFWRLSVLQGISVSVAHVNYGLRGRDSDADERLVRKICESRELQLDVLRKRPSKGKNLQDDARLVRYRFLGETAAKRGARIIATAHHMDDQAETILLHVIRGSGLRGLAGMSAKGARGPLTLIRPLLFASRKEIEIYAKRHRVRSRRDKTNSKSAYTRNRIRHSLLPALAKFNPRIVEALCEMGKRLKGEDDALALVALEAFEDSAAVSEQGRVSLRRSIFCEFPRGLRSRLLRLAFEKATGSTADLNADQIDKMDSIALKKGPGGQYRLRAPWKFVRDGDLITIRSSATKCDR